MHTGVNKTTHNPLIIRSTHFDFQLLIIPGSLRVKMVSKISGFRSCDIIICKFYMFGCSDDQTCITDLQLPKPWNFLSVQNDEYVFCYVSEVALESTLRMGTVMVGSFSPTS